MSIENKIALITGASGAVGKAIARGIALNREFKVVMLCRDESRARVDAEHIRKSTGNENVMYVIADVSRKEEIFRLAGSWNGPLHVLVNNAAVTPRSRQTTLEGIEMQWATNVLGYFWMITAFTEILKKSAPSRIVNVASYWAGGLDMEDPEFKQRRYNNDSAYRQTKQADRMLTVAFAEKLKSFNITVNSCHPGDVNSKLSNNLGFGGSESPEKGAATPVWLATSDVVETVTGKYFEFLKQSHCEFGGNRKEIERLFEICEQY
ncbi:MAG TPA: SDR family NAD(P)-dependent oxidoreductase [Cyclobacteriaceae bacterium]|nr:SDR family NAD(P)-dependent oxidoreductase [Cyclobacteriaceae bacterium]